MHIFHSGMPNCAKQGVPDACFKISSENPERLILRLVKYDSEGDEGDRLQ